MKGITHFIMGITALTFVESLMVGAALEDSLIIVLGGIFGLLPDTLDFKFLIYMEKHDVVIDPNPHDMRPQEIASKVADAINQAGTLRPGKMVKVQLHTLKLGPDLWQSYSIFFDTRKSEVVIRIGPHVTMSGVPSSGTEPPADKAIGTAKFTPKLIDRYGKASELKGFSGPSFGFLKKKDGSVEVVFIPFHRRSGHSLTLGALFALIGYLLTNRPIIAFAIFLPWTLHLILDQYGSMGNNLFWPLTKQRTSGLYLVNAGHPFWNAFIVYSCMALILWNMNRFTGALSPMYLAFPLDTPVWLYLLLAIVVPWVILGAIYIIYQIRFKPRERPTELLAPMTGAAAQMATEGLIKEEAEYEIAERAKPRLWIRSMGLVVLAAIFVVLYVYGGGW
ncbi:MAG: metal-dependent hydrolase [Desulfitobacteriaceae bacterium]|nr:metal-dependent hydrolase [Desulfitobacteriaceae bacterium]